MYIIILNGERLKDFPYVLGTHMQKDKSKQTLIHALHHTQKLTKVDYKSKYET